MIRVVLAEDVRILRDALVGLLKLEGDLDVVASVATGAEILPACLEHQPDVAVLDIELPEMDGLTAAAHIYEQLPGCRVLILTGAARPGNVQRGIAAHVAGFVLKDSPPADLARAIRTVAAGGRIIDPQLAYAALSAPNSPLTARESEVLRLTAAGASAREVSAELFLTYGTVRNYLASAVTKLGARNRVDAVRIATDAGWL